MQVLERIPSVKPKDDYDLFAPVIYLAQTFYKTTWFTSELIPFNRTSLNYPKNRMILAATVTPDPKGYHKPVLEWLEYERKEGKYRDVRIIHKDLTEWYNQPGWGQNPNVVNAYNMLREDFLETDADHWVHVDADVTLPANTIEYLLNGVAKGGDIVGGVTVVQDSQGIPTLPVYMETPELTIVTAKEGFARTKWDTILFGKNPRTGLYTLTLRPSNQLYKKIAECHAVCSSLILIKRWVLHQLMFELREPTLDLLFCYRSRRLYSPKSALIIINTGLVYQHLHYDYDYWDDKRGRRQIWTYRGLNKKLRRELGTVV